MCTHQELQLRFPCGSAGEVTSLYLAIFDSRFRARPLFVWQIYIHAAEAIALSCPLGQTARAAVAIRATSAARRVRCFSSSPFVRVSSAC
jgi:hypothetical protein